MLMKQILHHLESLSSWYLWHVKDCMLARCPSSTVCEVLTTTSTHAYYFTVTECTTSYAEIHLEGLSGIICKVGGIWMFRAWGFQR